MNNGIFLFVELCCVVLEFVYRGEGLIESLGFLGLFIEDRLFRVMVWVLVLVFGKGDGVERGRIELGNFEYSYRVKRFGFF